jgi:hypothetical protein
LYFPDSLPHVDAATCDAATRDATFYQFYHDWRLVVWWEVLFTVAISEMVVLERVRADWVLAGCAVNDINAAYAVGGPSCRG